MIASVTLFVCLSVRLSLRDTLSVESEEDVVALQCVCRTPSKRPAIWHGCEIVISPKHVRNITCVRILVYADDIILLSPSVSALQHLLDACESELHYLDISINVNKSVCTRVGSRHAQPCRNLFTEVYFE